MHYRLFKVHGRQKRSYKMRPEIRITFLEASDGHLEEYKHDINMIQTIKEGGKGTKWNKRQRL